MKKVSIFVVLACLLVSCESTNYVPPVTSQMTTAKKGQHVDLAMLREGRTLFVHRCIVDSMSHRASLKPAEREAIVAYVLAVRSTEH